MHTEANADTNDRKHLLKLFTTQPVWAATDDEASNSDEQLASSNNIQFV